MPPSNERSPGRLASLRAGWNAGLLVGFWNGLVDGIVAAYRTGTRGFVDVLGCLAGSVLCYALLWVVVLSVASALLHFRLRAKDLRGRIATLVTLGLALAFAGELYWWSREWLFYGVSSLDPRRLAVAAGSLVVGAGLAIVVTKLAARAPRGAKWAIALAVPIACLAGVAYLAVQSARSAERGALNDRNRDLPNVVLIVVDALRADVLSCYGHPRVQTPHIDRLAREGVLFERAMVQAPFTWSSFGSILTGKYPRRHGLVKMVPGVTMPPNVTLPWHLKSAKRLDGRQLEADDYVTAAFLTGTVSHGSGLARGFDSYFEALVGHALVEVENPWSVFRSELLISIFQNKLAQRLDAAQVAGVASDWLADHADRRFATKLHFYSTHTPYDPPAEFRDGLCDPKYDGPIRSFWAEHRLAIEQGKYVLTPADVAQIQNLYYAGVEQADAMIGQVLDTLERAGVLDQTLVIVTADHGEELGDHGLWEHNWMFQTNLQVPLVMRLPGKLPAGKRVDALVQSIDIVPTVCELAGIEAPGLGATDPREFVDGKSLVAISHGTGEPPHRYSFAENGVYLSIQDATTKLFVTTEALTPEGWAAALDGSAEQPHFYDLAADPNEKRNAIRERREDAERLISALREWSASMPIRRDELVQSDRDAEDLRIFRELGYVEGIGEDTHSSGHLPGSQLPGEPTPSEPQKK
ncbi:MAG: sulfatase-like hydrolase/transferase [Planctomycetes bacterium]|nr:sulfatase-like hydrolase/transferase [Planctomycetota bacterium]